MKKVLLIIALFLSCFTLKAVETVVKFELQDGTSYEYGIDDILGMSFAKSNSSYLMKIYTDGFHSDYNIKNINSLELNDEYNLKINLACEIKNIDIRNIDSIIFVPNQYNEIFIGMLTWMGKNLDVDHYRNGDPIPQVTDSAEWVNLTTGAWRYYNNDPAMEAIYGKLYNGYAVTDPRGLAPDKWYIPNNGIWSSVQKLLDDIKNTGGGKLKSIGTVEKSDGLWYSPNTGATDIYVFTALPSGYRSETGTFTGKGLSAKFWTSTNVMPDNLWSACLSYENAELKRLGASMKCGYSVRCQKPSPILVAARIESLSVNSAKVGDVITIYGRSFGDVQKRSSVSFNTIRTEESDYISWSNSEIKVKVPFGAKSGKITVTTSNVASNGVFFTVNGSESDVYEAVEINGAGWMSRNLEVDHYRNGDIIPQVTDTKEWENLKTGAWCYNGNDPSNGNIYGKLYNWYAVNDPRGLAPEGWHIPSIEEWTLLTEYLGGFNQAGGKMKSTGTTKEPDGLWRPPNIDATNESGFSAIPGGNRSSDVFGMTEFNAFWWTSSEKDNDNASYLEIYHAAASCRPYMDLKSGVILCVVLKIK